MKGISFRWLLVLVLVITGNLIYGQASYKFKKLSLNEGLSQSSAICILQDSRQFVWVGTHDGLNQYNGHEFRIFRHSSKNEKSISNNSILGIEEDRDGNIWFATDYGLNKWVYKTQQFERYLSTNTEGLKGHKFSHIMCSRDNKMWFVSEEAIGYIDVATNNCTVFPNISLGIDSNKFGVVLCESDSGQIWCASTSSGAAMFDGTRWQSFTHDSSDLQSLPSNIVRSIKKGPFGTIWLATSGGLANYNQETNSFQILNSKSPILRLPYDDLNDVDFDEYNNMWIVMREHGMAKISLTNYDLQHFSRGGDNSISSDSILSITIGNLGNIWLHLDNRLGVDLYNPYTRSFKHFEYNPMDPFSLGDNHVRSIYPGNQGEMWMATNSGVSVYNPRLQSFKHVSIDLSYTGTVSANSVRPIYKDSKKRLWVGTDGGLYMMNNLESKFISFKHNSSGTSIPNNVIFDIYEDSKKRIWIAHQEGISMYNEKNGFVNFFSRKGDHNIFSTYVIYENSEGELLAITGSTRFNKFDEKLREFLPIETPEFLRGELMNAFVVLNNELTLYGTFNGFYIYNNIEQKHEHFPSVFNDSTTVSHPIINDAVMLNDSTVYIATNNGLNVLDIKSKEFSQYFVEDGLPNQCVYHLLRDDRNNIWMSTNLGLSVMNTDTKQFINFDVNDGLQSNEFNLTSAHSSEDGYFYFGGINGYNYFKPALINLSSRPPSFYLTGLQVNGREISVDDNTGILKDELNNIESLKLKHDQSTFEIEFVGLDFLNANKLTYAYSLNDTTSWINLKTHKKISFNHLSPGKYRLHIKAIAADGVSNTMKTLTIVITPPLYTSTLFIILYILIIIFLIFSVFRVRTRRIKKQKKMLERTVNLRTKEVVKQRDLALHQKEEIEIQNKIIEAKNKEITDSIAYAKRIQSAILPSDAQIKTHLKDSFILYKPKDIVAGDFYWLEFKNDKVLFAAADCTGHGVPGAMVSVVCNNALNRSVREHGLTDPGKILDKSREIVIQEFEKSDEEVNDGMDIALCALNGYHLEYSGAHNPLWIIRDGKIITARADKQPIGKFDILEPYTTHSFDLKKGDTIYLFSDGYVDQFGGEDGKKFKLENFRQLLLSVYQKSMAEQKRLINDRFEEWKGDLDQIDDVCVIGVKV